MTIERLARQVVTSLKGYEMPRLGNLQEDVIRSRDALLASGGWRGRHLGVR